MPRAMDLRRIADGVMRCHASPLTTLFTPSIQWRATRSVNEKRLLSHTPGRFIAASSPDSAAFGSPPTTSSAAPAAADSESNRAAVAAKMNWLTPGRGSNRISTLEKSLNGGDSADNIIAMLQTQKTRKIDTSALKFGQRGNRDLEGLITSQIQAPAPKQKIRLSPATGRTVEIGGYVDIGRGFRMLEQSCARNKVRKDAQLQRFHERGGLKRKRLRKERWRRKFMEGFQATITRVNEIRMQGW